MLVVMNRLLHTSSKDVCRLEIQNVVCDGQLVTISTR